MQKSLTIICFLFTTLLYKSYAQSDSLLTFSEIMFAPLSGQTEFVEIHNTSETDTIDLAGFKLKYLHTTNTDIIISHASGTKLPPKSFAIIFESVYDFAAGNYNSLIPLEALIVKIDNGSFASGLANTTDRTLILTNSSNLTLDVYTYSANNSNGISDEKIILNKNNTDDNWKNSLTINGTPGFYNSVSPLQFDLGITNVSIFPEVQFTGSDIEIKFTVNNFGTNSAQNFSVEIYDDINSDSAAHDNEIIFSQNYMSVFSGDSINVNKKITLSENRVYQFILKINFADDENVSNNIRFIYFTPLDKPAQYNSIVINEIMYKPSNDEPEWVEIFNTTGETINLQNWSFGDKLSKVKIASGNQNINPGEYLIISEDESIYDFYAISSQTIILKIPSLNNSGDDLYIYDQYENIIDSVLYLSTWGGNNGNSLERINANDSSNSSLNWKTAVTKYKATPGKINSVTPKNYDLQIYNFSPEKEIVIFPETAKINIEIFNSGLIPAQNVQLNFYYDLNNDSAGTRDEIIHSTFIEKIESGKTFFYTFDFHNYGISRNFLIAEINYEADEFTENNTAITEFSSVIINEIRNDIIINEFMASPSSGLPEWIELFNRSEKVIDLKNYKIADESSEILITNKSLILNPGEYFLIIGDSSFFTKYNTQSQFIITAFPSLNNSSDKIIIRDSLNRVIDSLQYFSTWNGITGKSFERIDAEINSELIENWAVTKNKNGGTPGEINSVTQKSFDVGISQIYFNPQKPFYGDAVFISALIKNYGKENASLKLILNEENNLLEETDINIAPNDSVNYTFHFAIEKLESTRKFFLEVKFENDQDSTNNYFNANISPGYNYNSLIINEIMFTPQNGEPEWVEFYNKEDYKINLSGWSISDILTTPIKTIIIDTTFFIEPKSYFVITKDSSIINYHDSIPAKIIVSSFANLNNSEDGVVIKDFYENLIDSVRYLSAWETKTGYSIERISFEANSNDLSNWSSAIDTEQSTPGKRNSVSQKANDLAILDLSFSPAAPKFGSDVFINVSLKNEGFIEANNFAVRIYDSQRNNIIDEINIASLAKNDSLKLTSGSFKIFDVNNIFAEINFALDDNLSNNLDSIIVVPGFNKNDILINEVMFNPDTDKPEWIEFVNNSVHEINLFEWKVSDILPSPKEAFVKKENYKIFPSQYFIITNDTAAFRRNYNVDIPVFHSLFGSLGNSEDGIIIYDFYKNVIDSLFYTSDFGNVKGSSIERLSFTNGTNEINNWSVSINSSGSSPGFSNSVSETKGYEFNHVIINEIMYEPADNNSEFIEFYNNSDETIELGGWILENDKGEFFRIVNSNFILQPEKYFVAAADSAFISFYDFTGNENFVDILNKKDLGLTNDKQLIILKDLKGNIIDSVYYNSKWHNPNVAETKNKSLERLNPKINSNETPNWSTSANALGATPGKVNSIFTDNKFENSGLTISPNPFSPDNDGFEDFCTINYSLGIPLSQIRVKIFDDKGRLVKTLANNQPSGSTGSIIFNGLNENNSPLKIGMYIILFEALNAQTGQQEILKDVVVVARKL